MEKLPFWYQPTKKFLVAFFKIIYRLKILHTERFPMEGPVVLACNHVSLADPPIVGASSPRRVNIMAKEELFVPV